MILVMKIKPFLTQQDKITFKAEKHKTNLWHMNFFPSTKRVTSHNCWASSNCFNPEWVDRGKQGR